MAERSSALDSSSGVVRMWVRIPAWPVAALVSLSKTLNHNCFVLRMGRKTVGPVCCVMHVKEPRTLIMKDKVLAPVFLDSRLEHPAGLICARYKSSVLLLFCIITRHGMFIGSRVERTYKADTSNSIRSRKLNFSQILKGQHHHDQSRLSTGHGIGVLV